MVGGEWKEVKTVALGVVNKPVEERGEQVVHTRELTYFSRMSESGQFRASRPGGNGRAGGGEGGDGVCGERWSGLDRQVRGLPSPGCGAHPGGGLMAWSMWRKRAKPPTSSCLAQRNSPPRRSATSVQTGPVPAVAEAPTTRIENRRGKQGARRTEPVPNPDAGASRRVSSGDDHQEAGLCARTASDADVCDLSGAGLSHWEWECWGVGRVPTNLWCKAA